MAKRKGKGGQGKVATTRDQIRREFLALDDDELLAYVARHFCEGYPPAQIADLLRTSESAKWLRDPHNEVSREKITRLVLYAASRGWLHFQRTQDSELGEELRRRFHLHANHVRVVEDSEAAGPSLRGLVRRGDWVLVKGSRAMKMERVAEFLEAEARA